MSGGYTMRTRGMKRRIAQLVAQLPAGCTFVESDLLLKVKETVPLAELSGVRTTLYALAQEGRVKREGEHFRTLDAGASQGAAKDAVDKALAALADAEAAIRGLQAEVEKLARVRDLVRS